jgi:translation initiation factor IF-2
MEKKQLKEKRSPVVVVLGHVDHGKTTLLDKIRKTDVAGREQGGITQHIGAYEIQTVEKRSITFIDTPGHEAFQNLRQRGANIADVALLIVAADDSVQPQTVESIAIIKESKIPYIVVINKTDLPGINVEKVIKNLAQKEVYLEGRGGEVPYVEISAKEGTGINNLLELITLVSDLNNLEFNPEDQLEGGVVEVKKDRRGIVLTIILKNGMLKVGDDIFVDNKEIRVRALFNDKGENITELMPTTPAELLGSKDAVESGAGITGKHHSTEAKKVEKSQMATPVNTQDFFSVNADKFNFIIKADAFGTEEVIKEKLSQFDEINIVSSSVGELNETDVELAKTTGASIIAFNMKIKGLIEKKIILEEVNIFKFNLIYELLDQVEGLITALREKREKESRKAGEARILAKFNKETYSIAGMKIISGRIRINDKAEVFRGKKLIKETTIGSLYQKSNQVSEVKKGEECGALFEPKLDFQQGDIVKLYT